MAEANVNCPRFSKCSVNNCPLTAKYPDWPVAEDDEQKKCTLGKAYRVRLAEGHSELKYSGMTQREFKAKERWENLPPEEREKRRLEAKKRFLYGPHRNPNQKMTDDTSGAT